MADLLRKLLGRPDDPPPEVAAALEDLERVARERPALAGHAALLRDLIPGLFVGDGPEIGPPSLPPGQAAAKLAGGVPLLRGEPVTLNAAGLRRRWGHACAVIGRHPGGEAARAAAEAVRGGRLDLGEWVRELLGGRPEAVHAHAEALGLDAGLAATAFRFTVLPALASLNGTPPVAPVAALWKQGYCPVCGSRPLLGEYRGLEQARVLRCGFCAAEWPFDRLRCPYCDTRDHHRLSYFQVEGEEGKYRADTCEGCRGYVKALSTLGPVSAPQLLAADLATLHLDLVAGERGFVN